MTDRAPGTLFVPRDAGEAEALLTTLDHAGLPVAGPLGVFDAHGRERGGCRRDWTIGAYGRVAGLFARRAARAHAAAHGMAAESPLGFGKAPTVGPFPRDADERGEPTP